MKARTTPKAGILAHASTIHWQEFSFFKNRFGFDPFTHNRKFLYFLPFRCTQCKVLEHIIYIAAVFGFAREAKKRQDMIGPCVITSRFPSPARLIIEPSAHPTEGSVRFTAVYQVI